MLTDWVLVLACALAVIAAVTAVGVIFGAVLTVAATSSVGSVLHGALAGVYLSFSLWGVKSGSVSVGEKFVTFGSAFLPVPGVLAPIFAVVLTTRFAMARVAAGTASAVAFAAKLALVLGIVYSIAASLLSVGSAAGTLGPLASLGSSSDSGQGAFSQINGSFYARVSSANAFLYPLIITAIVAMIVVWRAHNLRPPEQLRAPVGVLGRAIRIGGLAYGLVVTVLGVLATVGAVIVADTGAKRLVVALSSPLVLLNTGVAAATTAMGASVAFSRSALVDLSGGGGVTSGHISLMHFGLPAQSNAHSAPIFLMVLLLAAPIALGWSVLNELTARPPSTEQQIVARAFEAGFGFAFVAWLGALLGRFDFGGIVVRHLPLAPDGIIGFLLLKPSAGAVLGLGLLWGLVSSAIAAFWWGSSHGVKWSFLAANSAAKGAAVGVGSADQAPPTVPTPSPAHSSPPQTPPTWAPSEPPAPAATPSTPLVTPMTDRALSADAGADWWTDTSSPAATTPGFEGTMPTERSSPPVAAPPPRPSAFCTQCGTSLPGDVAFCTNCGTRVQR